ncbi:MAG: MYG1 family protein [Opitutales bacterium]
MDSQAPYNGIVTHPGGAHKDEFLACSLLVARRPVPVFRREPDAGALEDPQTCVVDVGGEHAPGRLNFDHHQFPRDQQPTCALSLVLEHLGLYREAREFCEWLETTEWFDCRGPVDTADWLGVERDTLARLNSPLDTTLLRRFAAQSEHQPGEPVWELMRMVGEDLLAYIGGLNERLAAIEQTASFWVLPHEDVELKALFLPRTDPLPEDPSNGLGRYIERKGLENHVCALVYPDSRGQGYGLRRFNEHPALDFSRLRDLPDVHFTHARGFIAKTTATTPRRLLELLQLAVRRA